MKLIDPMGAVVSVREEKGQYLLTRGYKPFPEEPAPSEPAPSPGRRKSAPKK